MTATTTAPTLVPTVTSLAGADWALMTTAAAAATTVAEADRTTVLRFTDGTVVADLGLHARRALFCLCRCPLEQWRPSGPHDAWGFSVAADPLLAELRVGGFGASRDELDHLGPPSSLTTEISYAPWGRCYSYAHSASGSWLATLITFGPPMPVAEGPPATLDDAGDLTALIVERVRTSGMPGGRAPGRPPSPITTIAGMNAHKRMLVAAELVESGGFSQTRAAEYCKVSRESLNRRLRARRLERLTPQP